MYSGKMPLGVDRTHFNLLVFLGEFPTQFFQLILHRNSLVQLRFALVLVLLQLIRPLLALRIVAIQLFHIRQEFGIFLVDRL